MHAYQRFVRTEMDKRGWTAADLSRASGLSRQHLSRILGDDRDVLQRRPESSTIDALATAFGVSADYVLAFVAEAMGFPSGRVAAPDPSALSDDELLRLLAERLRRAREYERRDAQAAAAGDGRAVGLPVAGHAQPDGVTAAADAGAPDTNPGGPAGSDVAPAPRPRQGDYTRAAMTGTSDLDRLDAEAAQHGEESQDPDDHLHGPQGA